MASRKTYARTKAEHTRAPGSEEFERACFIADLIDGTVSATDMIEVRNAQGRLLRLEYDDPEGTGNGIREGNRESQGTRRG